jgi:hypothetical protein
MPARATMNTRCQGCGAGEGGHHLGATPKLVMYPGGPLCPVLAEKIRRYQEQRRNA